LFCSVAALFNQERQEYNQKLEDVAVAREDHYKLRWELNQRDTEIAELQKALSDAHVYLYDEREHVLQLQAECDELKGLLNSIFFFFFFSFPI
jgi:coiled-coil domain-containing protein 77